MYTQKSQTSVYNNQPLCQSYIYKNQLVQDVKHCACAVGTWVCKLSVHCIRKQSNSRLIGKISSFTRLWLISNHYALATWNINIGKVVWARIKIAVWMAKQQLSSQWCVALCALYRGKWIGTLYLAWPKSCSIQITNSYNSGEPGSISQHTMPRALLWMGLRSRRPIHVSALMAHHRQ